MKIIGLVEISALTIAVAGCTTPAEPGPRLEAGVISFYGDPVVIDVPDVVQADIPFDVSVRTYGGGCITKDITEVAVASLRADVRPLDAHSGDELCTSELRMFEHTASLTFHEPGEATVSFRGTAQPGDSAIVVVRRVQVQ